MDKTCQPKLFGVLTKPLEMKNSIGVQFVMIKPPRPVQIQVLRISDPERILARSKRVESA
jgi:hypothetical protein